MRRIGEGGEGAGGSEFGGGQVEAELVTEIDQPFGRNAVLADPHLDRIARHQADRGEGDEHQRNERRNGQREATEEINEHWRVR